MLLGFTSTTFKQLSPAEICGIGAKAGADCIEWSEPHIPDTETAKSVAALCANAGIASNSVGSYYRVGENDAVHWELLCKIASILGAERIRVWLGTKGSARTDDDEYENLLADAGRMISVAENYGLIIASEAHQNTYNDSCESSLRFLRDINSPVFGTYYQSLYLNMTADLERLEQTFPYIKATHVSFSEVRRNQRMHLLSREKNCVERIVRTLISMDYKEPLILEYVQSSNADAFQEDLLKLRNLI